MQQPPPGSLSASCCQSAQPDKAGLLQAVWAGAARENTIKDRAAWQDAWECRRIPAGARGGLEGMRSLL